MINCKNFAFKTSLLMVFYTACLTLRSANKFISHQCVSIQIYLARNSQWFSLYGMLCSTFDSAKNTLKDFGGIFIKVFFNLWFRAWLQCRQFLFYVYESHDTAHTPCHICHDSLVSFNGHLWGQLYNIINTNMIQWVWLFWRRRVRVHDDKCCSS